MKWTNPLLFLMTAACLGLSSACSSDPGETEAETETEAEVSSGAADLNTASENPGATMPADEKTGKEAAADGGTAKGDATEEANGNLSPGPVTTFSDRCSRCHGPQGMFYGEAFADMPPEELNHILREMMEGPGGMRPTDPQVQAMAAYHRALRQDVPFGCITNAREIMTGKPVQGEVTPGAAVTIHKDDQDFTAQVDGMQWQLDDSPEPPFQVRIEKQGQTATFDFPDQICVDPE